MLPLPHIISRVITAPNRILLKKDLPKSRKEVIYTFTVYAIILATLSLPFLVLDWPPGYGWAEWPFGSFARLP